MSIYDYFSNRVSFGRNLLNEFEQWKVNHVDRQRGTLLPPRTGPTNPAPGYVPVPSVETQSVTPTPTVEDLTPDQRRRKKLAELSEQIRQLQQTKPVDNDKSLWKRLGSIGREFVIQAGSNFASTANSKMSNEQRLMQALGAGGVGAAGGALIPTLDEERQRQYDIAHAKYQRNELYGEEQLAQKDLQARLKTAKDANDLQLDQAQAVTLEDGTRVYIKGDQIFRETNTNAREEANINATQQRDLANRISREELARLSREQQLEMEKARLLTDATKTNISNQIHAEEKYTTRVDAWARRQMERAVNIQKIAIDSGVAAEEAKAMAQSVSEGLDRVTALTGALEAEQDSTKRKYLQKRLDDETDAYNKLVNDARIKIGRLAAQNGGNAQLMEALKSVDDPRPQRSKIPTFKPTLPQGRKPVSASRDPLGLFK